MFVKLNKVNIYIKNTGHWGKKKNLRSQWKLIFGDTIFTIRPILTHSDQFKVLDKRFGEISLGSDNRRKDFPLTTQ